MRVRLVAVCFVLCSGIAAIAQPTSRPVGAPQPVPNDPVAAVQPFFDALVLLGVRGNATPAEVSSIVEPAMGLLDATRRDTENRLKDLQAAGAVPRPRDAGAAAGRDRPALRERLCAIELLRGDLHCAAAEVLRAAGGDAATLLDTARQAYQRARVDYHDLAISFMGHIGEAKALRIMDKVQESAAALSNVLDPNRAGTNGIQTELNRLAMMERIELLLVTDPAVAEKQAGTWRSTRPLGQDQAWSARADWMLARAKAGQYLRLEEKQGAEFADVQLQAALKELRAPAVVGTAPHHERLKLIVRLEASAGRDLMTREELVEWADLLVAAERPDALKIYQRAVGLPGEPLAVQTLLRFGVLLLNAGEPARAVEWSERILARTDVSDEQRIQARQLQAIAWVKLFRGMKTDAERQKHAGPTLSALAALIEEGVTEDVLRDALRQWADICGQTAGLASCVTMLESHRELAEADPYLLYVLAAGYWDEFRHEQGAAASQESAGAAIVQKVTRLLDEVAARGTESDGSDVAARAVLLKSRVLAESPSPDKRAALQVLVDGWKRLEAQPPLVDEAVARRLELLIDLGLADEAATFMDGLPQGTSAHAGTVSLALAEMLAQRRSGRDGSTNANDQKKVVQLAQRAIAAAIQDDRAYPDSVLRAARVMLEVNAGADARAVLDALLKRADVRNNPNRRLTCSLLLARAHLQQRQLNEAAVLYDYLVGEFPKSHDVLLARGRMEIELGSPSKAVPWFRRARQELKPGSEPWCEATLALVEALIAQGDRTAAADILRVAGALYPDFGSPERLRSFRMLRARLAEATPSVLAEPSGSR